MEVQLDQWDDMIHVFPLFGLGEAWPEVDEAFAKMSAFIAEKLGSYSYNNRDEGKIGEEPRGAVR